MAWTLRRLAASNAALIVALAILASILAAHFWPASWWFEARSVYVADARETESPLIVADRTIYRPFHAEWRVRVWRHETDGEEVACEAIGGGDYRPTARQPRTVTLDWYSAGQCRDLPPGRYSLTVTWRIARGVLPPKVVRASSNIWTIHP